MSNENKMRIICDPFKKEIKYEWYDYGIEDYVEFDSENSKLASDELVNATIQNRAYEIVDIINSECNVGNVGLEIVFIGTDGDYKDFCRVIDTYYRECNIRCIRGSHYYKSAIEVMPEIKKRFADVETVLAEYMENDIAQLIYKYNDTVRPSISLCIIGLYSAGKSAFINSIVGAEILPSDSDPTTAKVCKIIYSKDYKIKFGFDGKKCILTFKNDKCKFNSDFDKDSIRSLQKIISLQKQHDEVRYMNVVLSIINNYKNDKHQISDMVEIEIPFIKTSFPVKEFDFVMYDTPGSNSKNNKKHFEVLRDSLDGQTNALPIFLTTPDTMDAEDNDKILKLIENIGTSLDTTNAITVVNKADEKGPKTLREKRDKVRELSITKWKSTQIFFMSSVIGIASKKNNPDDLEQWLDEDMQEIYDEKKDKYAKDDRKLFDFNIVDRSKVDGIGTYRDGTQIAHLYKNCGLESVEKEIVEYAQRYALYNKCSQASLYLQKAIDMCVDNIQEAEQQLNLVRDEAKEHFDIKKKELCDKLANKKEDIVVYNTAFQKEMEKELKTYTKKHNIDTENSYKFEAELLEMWQQFEKIRKRKGREKKWSIEKIKEYVEDKYTDLVKYFSEKVNEKIMSFWNEKSKLFKSDCIEIVHDSDALTNEQKEMLESIVMLKNNMDTHGMKINLREMNAIRRKKFLFWELKSEKFDATTCRVQFVGKFYNSVGEKIIPIVSENEKNFKKWTDELINKLEEEMCKFNSDLSNSEKKIVKLNKEINIKKECVDMLEKNKQYIEELLDIQGGEEHE